MAFLTRLRKLKHLSERDLANKAGLARETIRACELNPRGAKVENLEKIAHALDFQVVVAIVPAEDMDSNLSTVAASIAIQVDGFDSWKMHFMNLVDHFRRTRDMRLLLLPPVLELDEKLQALLASIVCALCKESDLEPPEWAKHERFLRRPWFVAGMESLKASALIESPLVFRRNNIFVHENFLRRA